MRLLPGISSVQAFAAKLRRPWQDWLLCSAHGVDCDAVAAVCQDRPAFFLTGGKTGPAEICRELTDAGLGLVQGIKKIFTVPDKSAKPAKKLKPKKKAETITETAPEAEKAPETAPETPVQADAGADAGSEGGHSRASLPDRRRRSRR